MFTFADDRHFSVRGIVVPPNSHAIFSTPKTQRQFNFKNNCNLQVILFTMSIEIKMCLCYNILVLVYNCNTYEAKVYTCVTMSYTYVTMAYTYTTISKLGVKHYGQISNNSKE